MNLRGTGIFDVFLGIIVSKLTAGPDRESQILGCAINSQRNVCYISKSEISEYDIIKSSNKQLDARWRMWR